MLLVLSCKVTCVPVFCWIMQGFSELLCFKSNRANLKRKASGRPRTISMAIAQLTWSVPITNPASLQQVEELNLFFACFEAASPQVTTLSTSPQQQHPHCGEAWGAGNALRDPKASWDRCWGPSQISWWEFWNSSQAAVPPCLKSSTHSKCPQS